MEPETIYNEIENERNYQIGRWGVEFDRLNTRNDWATFICFYATRGAVAALCVAAIERIDAGEVAPRHYDEGLA